MENRPSARSAAAPADWWWIFDPRISLRARAALLAGGGAILFTALVSTLAGAFYRGQLERQAGPAFEGLAFQVGDKIDRHLHQLYTQVQFAASLAPLRAAEATPGERRRLLDAVLDNSPDFAWVGFADAWGDVVAGTQGWFERTNVADRVWFRAARDKPYAGNVRGMPELARLMPEVSADSQPRFIDFAAPVTSPAGQFLGVVGAQVRWHSWPRDVQLSVVPESANRDRLGVTIYSSTGDVLHDSGASGWSQPLNAPAVTARRGSLEENVDGIKYVTGFARSQGFREFRGFGWLVAVRQPADLVFAPVRRLQHVIVGWGIFFGLVVVVASWLTAGRLARRMAAIAATARRIGTGDVLTTMPRPPGEGEMAKMCGALGDMVEDLRTRAEKPAAPQPPASETRPW